MPRYLLIACWLASGLAMASESVRDVSITHSTPATDTLGRLVISRDKSSPNACNVELYVNQNSAAQIAPGQSLRLDVPSGELSLSAALSQSGYCTGTGPGAPQSVLLGPGQTRHFDIRVEGDAAFLAPVTE